MGPAQGLIVLGYRLTETIIRNFQFPEKEEVNKYYPQYYHKTDKVSSFPTLAQLYPLASSRDPL